MGAQPPLFHCPDCGSPAHVLDSRYDPNQNARTRYLACTQDRCGKRWKRVSRGPSRSRGAHSCPLCGEAARIIETRVAVSNGSRRRRLRCQNESCGHRWSTWLGPRPGHVSGSQISTQRVRGRASLSEDDVRFILQRRDLSHRAAGRILGCSAEQVRLIRIGEHRANVAPEIPRWHSSKSCFSCQHWRGAKCGMGFPDPETEGPFFAADCALFSPEASAETSPAAGADSAKPTAAAAGR